MDYTFFRRDASGYNQWNQRLRSYCQPALLILAACLAAPASAQTVSSLGFIEPENGVMHITGALSSNGSVVQELHVKDGDNVNQGQIIAVLDNHYQLKASLEKAESHVAIKTALLERVSAGISEKTRQVHEAGLERLNVELKTAVSACDRFKALWKKKEVARQQLEEKCLKVDVLRQQQTEARARLDEIQEVRDVDIAVAQAELHNARADVALANANLERSIVRAPVDGQILKVHTYPGEAIGLKGLVELGQTQSMWVSAEVYETDIQYINEGQPVRVTSDGFSGELTGTVEQIGLLVGRNQLVAGAPTADVDARIIEVRIRLSDEDGRKVARLINLQVNVVIGQD